MGSPSASGGRTDSGQMNSTTTTKLGVGDINEKGKRTSKNAYENTGSDEGFFKTERDKNKKNLTQHEKNMREMRGSGNQVVQSKTDTTVTSPTTAEVSQSATTEAEDPIMLRKRKAKARGRSPTIMTGVTGVTGDLTLGKPSLLGR